MVIGCIVLIVWLVFGGLATVAGWWGNY
jgi:uncharacterized membrane protein YccF (DUF307 family)